MQKASMVAVLVAVAVAAVAADKPKTRHNKKEGVEYVWIPAGEFTMGCQGSDCAEHKEPPAHQVRLTKGFWMARTEVPVGSYKKFVKDTGHALPPPTDFRGRILN